MNNIENFVFFDSTSTSGTSNILYNSNRGTQLTVQVSGGVSCNVKFQGKVDYDATSFADLAIIDLKTMETLQTITSDGIYCVPMTSVSQCQAVCTTGLGSVKVYGVIAG